MKDSAVCTYKFSKRTNARYLICLIAVHVVLRLYLSKTNDSMINCTDK